MKQYGLNPPFLAEIKAKGPVVTYALERPIPGFDGSPVSELNFREPTGGDILLCGNPIARFDPETGTVEFNEAKTFEMMSALCGIQVHFLMRMTPNDTVACMYAIAPFFIPGLKTLSTRPTEAQHSGQPEQPVS